MLLLQVLRQSLAVRLQAKLPQLEIRAAHLPALQPSVVLLPARQVVAPHWVRSTAGAQLPSLPLMLHRLQVPQEDDPQHTPSTQLPVRHLPPPVQVAPLAALATHRAPAQ